MKTHSFSRFRTSLLASLATAALGVGPQAIAAPIPLLSYDFNEAGGSTALNSGSLGVEGDMTMRNANGVPVNQHDVAGSGVSGLPEDYAFFNWYGQANTPSPAEINGLKSLTVAGWFKTLNDDPIASQMRLVFNNQFSPLYGFDVSFNGGSADDARLRMDVWDGSSAHASAVSGHAFGAKEEWVFFAATWDMASSTISFFTGTQTSSVTAAGSTVVNTIGVTGTNTGSLALANLGDWAGQYPRPFNGLLDNIALWGSQTDSSGALSQADLEAFRATAIPEPGMLGLTAISGVCFFAFRQMQKKK